MFLKRFSPTPPACYFSSRFSFAANSPLCFERYARVSHPICLLVFLKIVFASNSVAFFERVARTSEFFWSFSTDALADLCVFLKFSIGLLLFRSVERFAVGGLFHVDTPPRPRAGPA